MIIGTQYISERTLNTDFDLDWWQSRKTLLIEHGAESGKNSQYESDREFWDLSRKYKYILIRPTVQELWSLQFGGAAKTQFWTDRRAPSNLNFGSDAKWNLRYFKTKLVDNWLSFPMRIYELRSDDQSNSYDHLKTAADANFIGKLEMDRWIRDGNSF
jgi:hypothetical protein